ncbi:MAG: M64 family metallopeptidase [Parabacteroides sp.]
MRTKFLFLLIGLTVTVALQGQSFSDYFADKTLRLDYLFVGNAERQEVTLRELSCLPGWAGRRHHLAELPLKGDGQIHVRDKASGVEIYSHSFSSLFQEWLDTDEANGSTKGFENTFLVPFPLRPVEIEALLFNARGEVATRFVHTLDPADILIHTKGTGEILPYKYIWKAGDVEQCIDIAILAEGYTKEEMERFYQDAEIAAESLFNHEPFRSMKDRFNIVAVASPSIDSGVSVPRLGEWRRTAFGSHFSTFYSDRYLTTSDVRSIHDALSGIAYEHIIILANTDEYGGGGIYNAFTLTTAHHKDFRPVVVHEFGHSFGGLADEYFYENDTMTDTTPLDVEPWEQNITTRIDFASKWEGLLVPGTPVPTPAAEGKHYPVGVYEGGGYSTKGVYRPADYCRMRVNEWPEFCPVCQRALRCLIDFYTQP